jgi:methylglutaconyl-CoA hydratase
MFVFPGVSHYFAHMDLSLIRSEHKSRRAIITLNRPQKRNALNDVMIAELTTAFQAAARDAAVKVVLLRAEGSAFSSGADLAQIRDISQRDLEQNRVDSSKFAFLLRTVYELRKPVIAAVQGPALAGGCGLASVCDFVIAANELATFGLTEVHRGFVPAVVIPFLIKRVGEARTRELALRGNILSALEARSIGLATNCVPDATLATATDALADELITLNSATSMGFCKELIAKLHGLNLVDSLDFAANVNAAARMTADCKEGIEAFLQKTSPKW